MEDTGAKEEAAYADMPAPLVAVDPESAEPKELTEERKRRRDESVVRTKEFRVQMDATLQGLKGLQDRFRLTLDPDLHRQIQLAIDAAEEVIMRLGMTLKALNPKSNPYPNSYKPENTIVDPTADGLTM